MRILRRLGLPGLLGMSMAVVATASAQNTDAPVLAMIEVQITDPAVFFGKYVPGHLPSVQKYGGKFLIEMKTEKPLADAKLQGTSAAQVFIVQEWPSLDAFNRWWNSPEYAPWNEIRSKSANVKLTIASKIVH